MTAPLTGAWAVVLGASSGIGRACALALARQGVHIIGIHFDVASAEESVRELLDELRGCGVEAHLFNRNAVSKDTRAELVPRIAELTDGLGPRILLHSLAFGTLAPYLPRAGFDKGITQPQMDMTFTVMAHSLVYWVQDLFAADLLLAGAHVYAMTSAGTTQAVPSYGAVSAAKCALESHVRHLACELASRGVAVNALRAGITITPALLRIPEHEDVIARAAAGNPHGRLTQPEDVAAALVLLASTTSSWMTGNVIGVDGGELHAAGPEWNRRVAVQAGRTA